MSDTNKNNLHYFENDSMRGLYNAMGEWQQHKDDPDHWRSYCGASCWRMDDNLSLKAWNEYIGKQQVAGVVIQSTVGRLQQCIGHETIHGWVKYGVTVYGEALLEPRPGEIVWQDIVMFHKPPNLSWEQEYRALLYADVFAMERNNGGLNVPVKSSDLAFLIEKIYLPRDWRGSQRDILNIQIEEAGLGSQVEEFSF